LEVPKELGNQELAKLGYVDVTASPFFADSSGKKDSTEALQLAINFSRDHQMVCYFPSGTYLISGTLSCIQNLYLRSSGRSSSGRNFPCLVVGSRRGVRPKILLRPNSPGFGNPNKPKYVIHFWARSKKNAEKPQPNISMNQMLVNVDIVIGEGNAGAVGIRHRGAQGSGIQDCTVDATYGLTGIEGGIGSGGSLAGVTIIGGVIGLDLRETQPVPTITGVTLIRQEETAIVYEGRQSLCAVGIKIVSNSKGPLIKTLPAGYGPARGQSCFVDSEIVFEKPGGTAISAAKSLYLKNVYVKGAANVASQSERREISGNVNGWIRIVEYAHGVRPRKWRGYQYESPVYIDGKRSSEDVIESVFNVAPPKNLQSRHLWRNDFPTWESGGVVNVKAPPYNAKGDGRTDDTSALQRAVNENDIVFLPKGYYYITKSIKLKPNTKLIGVARHLSIIMAWTPGMDFRDPEAPKPLVETNHTKNAETVVAFCALYVPKIVPGAYALKWQCGSLSILRAVNFITQPLKGYRSPGKPKPTNTPLVIVAGNGGGKWYNFFLGGYRAQGPEYRHVLVHDSTGPLGIYQCTVEYAQGNANMEIRNSKHVSIYGLKGEGNHCILKIEDSDHIKVFGYGGNAAPFQGNALFIIQNTPNFLIANAVDAPRLPHKKSSHPGVGRGIDPKFWHMISDRPKNGKALKTMPFERPVLYRRGNPFSPIEPAAN
jgi:hypothetical protein